MTCFLTRPSERKRLTRIAQKADGKPLKLRRKTSKQREADRKARREQAMYNAYLSEVKK